MIRELPPYVIQVGEDYHRDLQLKGLRQLVLSIAGIGLTDPIVVRRKAGEWRLVAGRRRLAAVMQLEWATVPCLVIRANDRRAKMIELDSNLCVAPPLSPAEEALALLEIADPAAR